MNHVSRSLFFVLLLVTIGSAQAQRSSIERLPELHTRFRNYHQDFLDFAQSGLTAGSEFDSARELARSADETTVFLGSAETLVDIYYAVSSKEDRDRIRPMIQRDLAFYRKRLDFSIKETNLELSYMKRPGVVAEATRMRDDLREAKNIFDSIELR